MYVGSQAEVTMGAFTQFQDSTKQNAQGTSTSDHQHLYYLRSKQKKDKFIPSHK